MHSADLGGGLDILKYLIDEKGSDFTVTDNKGFTPVYCAVLNGHLVALKCLIDEKGIDFTVTDNKGHTPCTVLVKMVT